MLDHVQPDEPLAHFSTDVLGRAIARCFPGVEIGSLGTQKDVLAALQHTSTATGRAASEVFLMLCRDRQASRELGFPPVVIDPTILPASEEPPLKGVNGMLFPLARNESSLTCVCPVPLLSISHDLLADIAQQANVTHVQLVYAFPSLFNSLKRANRAAEAHALKKEEPLKSCNNPILGGDNPPYLRLDGFRGSATLNDIVPIRLQRRYGLIPLYHSDNSLTVAVKGKQSLIMRNEIESLLNEAGAISYAQANPDHIDAIIAANEMGTVDSAHIINGLINHNLAGAAATSIQVEEIDAGRLEEQANVDGSIVALVDALIVYAVNNRASDLHIVRMRDDLVIEYRLDDWKYPYPEKVPVRFSTAIISRIKVISNIDLQRNAEPQYGQFVRKIKGKGEIEVRVTMMPTVYGDKATLRFASKESELPTLEELGFAPYESGLIKRFIDGSFGLMLVVGPTGSGKSTTLYSSLALIDTGRYEVISAEDPVERYIKGIRQTEIGGGLTYETFVEGALRADPDYINVGETRSPETASQVIKAAETGHLVFTTLHTHRAAAAPGRLFGLGVKPYELADALSVVIAQQLLPNVCPKCAEEAPPQQTVEEMRSLGVREEWFGARPTFMEGKGCAQCRHRGVYGRSLIAEGFQMTTQMQQLLLNRGNTNQICAEQEAQGGKTLLQHAIEAASAGRIPLQAALSLGGGARD